MAARDVAHRDDRFDPSRYALVGPLWVPLLVAVAISLAGVPFAFLDGQASSWLGWSLGTAGLLTLVIFRFLNMGRQMHPRYSPSVWARRVALFTVVVAVAVIVASAWKLAERVTA